MQADLVHAAIPSMQALSELTQESSWVGVLDVTIPGGIVLHEVRGQGRFTFHLETGVVFPLHTAAPGKAMLAFSDSEVQNTVLPRMEFTRYTEHTITDSGRFRDELQTIRLRGYALDMEEEILGCRCIGAPVRCESGMAALWTAGSANRVTEERLEQWAPTLMQLAEEITDRLAHRSRDQVVLTGTIREARQRIAESIHESLDMEQLAKELHLSYSWFRQCFKRITGHSPNQYLIQCRLEKAKELLRHTERPILEIAESLNFSSQHYFSRLFRQKTGLTPTAYRQQ